MRRIIAILALLVLAAPAFGQGSPFPPTLPGNSLYGRLGGGTAGPGQAIPITTVRAQMLGTANVRGVSPTDTGYGGVCNSSTASTANLAAFVAAAAASPVVFIPANCTYYMDATTLPAGLRYLYGQGGQGSSIIRQPDGAAANDFSYLQYSSSGLVLEHLTIESQRIAAHGKRGLFLSSASFVRISDVEFKSGTCLGIQGSDSILVADSHCSSRTNRGISGEAPASSNIVIKNFRISQGTHDVESDQGIIFEGVNGLDIEGGYIDFRDDGLSQNTGSNGIVVSSILDGTSTSVVTRAKNIKIHGVHIETNSIEPIVLNEVIDARVIGNLIVGPSKDNGIGIYANGAANVGASNLDTYRIVVANNVLSNIGSTPIVVNWDGIARAIDVTGNVVQNAGVYASFAGVSWGISLNADTQANVVGNYVYDQYGTTSSTSNTVAGSGSKTWTVASSTLPYVAGDTLRAVDTAAPTTNYMQGTVSSYSGTTLTLTVTSSGGSGTKTSWAIGRMLYAIAENTGTHGGAPNQNFFQGNKVNGSSLGGTSYGLVSTSSRVIEGNVIKQPSEAAGAGLRILLSSDDAQYWDAYQTSAQALRFAKNGVSGFSIDPTGNIYPDGYINFTNIAAPSSPSAGHVVGYTDSTDLRFHDKNASGTIGTTVVADTGASNNFLTAISAAGVISKAQPSISNISGLGTGVATFLGTPSSANLASAITDETGTGLAVFNIAPAITGNLIVTAPATGTSNTLTIAAGGNTASDVPTFRITSLAGTVVYNQFGDAANGNFRNKALGSVAFHAGNVAVSAANEWFVVNTDGSIRFGDGTGKAHVASSGSAAPALTSCGTGSPSILGSDTAGTVTMGTSATGCVITFASAWGTAPHCTVTWRGTPLATQTYTVSTAAITTTQTSTSGNLLDYVCIGHAI